VRRGQVLGLLGNSGNSDAPHLHFHVMDGPSPLLSNGLPYVFTSFHGQGVVPSLDALLQGPVVPIDRSAMSGLHHDELPLNLDVVSFHAAPSSVGVVYRTGGFYCVDTRKASE
jgi:murein DD-endopeptidase MepM/ murein hydrolase activator NlpD